MRTMKERNRLVEQQRLNKKKSGSFTVDICKEYEVDQDKF